MTLYTKTLAIVVLPPRLGHAGVLPYHHQYPQQKALFKLPREFGWRAAWSYVLQQPVQLHGWKALRSGPVRKMLEALFTASEMARASAPLLQNILACSIVVACRCLAIIPLLFRTRPSRVHVPHMFPWRARGVGGVEWNMAQTGGSARRAPGEKRMAQTTEPAIC